MRRSVALVASSSHAQAAAVLALAVVVRVLLLGRYPLFLTLDSPAFLVAGHDLASRLDFFSVALSDWRLPGYPVWVAIVRLLFGPGSHALAAAQAFLGLLAVALALWVTGRLGWMAGRLLLASCLAIHPLYLLFEHTVMSEAVLVAFLWSFVAVSLWVYYARPHFGHGLGLGLVLAVCLLIRSNTLVFLGVFCGLLLVGRLWLVAPSQRWMLRDGARVVTGVVLAATCLLGAWSYRNYLYSGEPRLFTGNVRRALLLYHAQHGLIDADLPAMASYSWNPRALNESAYSLLADLGSRPEPEVAAAALLREQLLAHPTAYVRQVIRSFGYIFGLPAPLTEHGREDLTYWLEEFGTNLPRLHSHNRAILRSLPDFHDEEVGRRGRVLVLWRSAGLAQLAWGRGVLAVLFGAAFLYLLYRGYPLLGRVRATVPDDTLIGLACGVALLSSAAFHAVLLADYDRFAVPFEGFQLLVVCAALETARRRRGSE